MTNHIALRRPVVDIEEVVSKAANSLLNGKRHIKLLEAGCGSASRIKLNASVYAVGVDISREQLDQNTMLQEKILGDIQGCALPEQEFDIVICWMVLEHLSRPKDALRNLFRAVKPQGLLILGFPNLLSAKKALAKVTPFWFHKLFYRYMKYTSRHFPTYLRAAILPKRVMRLAEDHGFAVEFCTLLEDPVWTRISQRFWFMGLVLAAGIAVTRLVSLGKVQSPLLDNCGLILRKASAIR